MTFNPIIQSLLIISIAASGFMAIGNPLTGILLLMLTTLSCCAIFAKKVWLHYDFSSLICVYLAWLLIVGFTKTVPSSNITTLAALSCLPLMYLIATNLQNFNDSWKILSNVFSITALGFAIWAICQVYFYKNNAQGPLSDRNAFAALMNLLWFPTVYLFIQNTEKTNKTTPALFGISIFLMSTALFATTSRGGIAIWLLLQPLLLWAIFKYTQSKKITAIIPAICILAFLSSSVLLKNNVLDRSFELPKNLNTELTEDQNFSSSNDQSSLLRVLLIKSTFEIARDNPLLGTGWGTFIKHYPAYRDKAENHTPILYTHNDYLQLASEGGFLTPLLLIALLISILKQLIQNLKLVKNDANFESVILLLGVLTIFIHASLNFIFYYAFMSTIAGLYLARASQLTQQAKSTSLANLMLFRPYARRIVAGFILLLLALPFVTRQISMSTLSGSKTGLKLINVAFPSVTASSVAHFITAIYPKEQIAQEFSLLEIEDTLVNSNFNDSTHFEIKSQYLRNAIDRFDFVRAQTVNDPDIGVREANILIKHHNFFDDDAAYIKANKVLNDNLKSVPYHPDTYIMQSRLEMVKGNSTKAFSILKNAEKEMITQLDHRLIYVEILRQQSTSTEAETLNKLESDIRQARTYIDSGKRNLVPATFGPNLDMRLTAYKKRIGAK